MEACSGSAAGVGYKMLMFDCGGSQLVKEFCFKINTDASDLDFVQNIMGLIEENRIPAHSPIEQRFSAASSSFLAPNYSADMKDR